MAGVEQMDLGLGQVPPECLRSRGAEDRVAAHRKTFRKKGEKASRRLRHTYDQTPHPSPTPDNAGEFLHNGARAKAGTNRSIAQEAWGRAMTMLTYKTARNGGQLVKVPAPCTSQRCSACGLVSPGSRESQEKFVCKNPDCGFVGNADWNAARNVLHLCRIGHVIVEVPAAGRRGRRAGETVKPTAAM